MDQPISRRAWLGALVSATGALAAACSPGTDTTEVRTAEGRVLQWEGDDLIVLVSNLQDRYPAGQPIHLSVLVNNQSTRPIQARVRTKLLGLGDQAISDAEIAVLSIAPADAANTDRDLPVARNTQPGDYTVSVEIPPWTVDGRATGRGATLRGAIKIDPPSS
jgi:hypothetical protein